MAVEIKEICALLDAHAEVICPSLCMKFLPLPDQPYAVVAHIKYTRRVVFEAKKVVEAVGPQRFGNLFKHKVNDALYKLAETALDAEIE